jgi:hypothetical protein
MLSSRQLHVEREELPMPPGDSTQTVRVQHGGKMIEIAPVADAEVEPTSWRPTRLVFSRDAVYGAPSLAAYVILVAMLTPFAVGTVLMAVRGDWLTAGFVLVILLGLVGFWVWTGKRHVIAVRFDRATGQVTVRTPHEFFKAPLTNVVAVQVVPGKKVAVLPLLYRTAYQLNVILDDPALLFISLSYCPDRGWTRRTGQHLAAFLDVTLVDQCPASPGVG